MALVDQLAEQLRVVHDLVVAAELRVLVGERVEAVRAGRDDLDVVLAAGADAVERLDVLLAEHLEDELVAQAPGRVAGAGLAWPRTANSTPAVCSSSATARVTFLERSSSAPAQPTQNRYSTSSGMSPSTTRTSKDRPSVQSSRALLFSPHGLPAFSRLRSITPASLGNADSISTW